MNVSLQLFWLRCNEQSITRVVNEDVHNHECAIQTQTCTVPFTSAAYIWQEPRTTDRATQTLVHNAAMQRRRYGSTAQHWKIMRSENFSEVFSSSLSLSFPEVQSRRACESPRRTMELVCMTRSKFSCGDVTACVVAHARARKYTCTPQAHASSLARKSHWHFTELLIIATMWVDAGQPEMATGPRGLSDHWSSLQTDGVRHTMDNWASD